MAQQFHDDARGDALDQKERCARVAKVVEPTLGESCATKVMVELLAYARRVDRPAAWSREDEIGFGPPLSSCGALPCLGVSVIEQ